MIDCDNLKTVLVTEEKLLETYFMTFLKTVLVTEEKLLETYVMTLTMVSMKRRGLPHFQPAMSSHPMVADCKRSYWSFLQSPIHFSHHLLIYKTTTFRHT